MGKIARTTGGGDREMIASGELRKGIFSIQEMNSRIFERECPLEGFMFEWFISEVVPSSLLASLLSRAFEVCL